MALNLKKPPNLSPKLKAFPYQLEAVRAVCDKYYAAIFHEQGLGKTKIAIDIALYWLKNNVVDVVFIITKKALVKNWHDEFKLHSHIIPKILSDNRRENSSALNSATQVYVLNYEVCHSNFILMETFLKTCNVGVILDESQKIKNPQAQLTQSFISLSENFARRLILTGTPVANRPQDIWSQIKFLDNGKALGDNFEKFKAEVDLPEQQADGHYISKLQDIQNKIRNFSLRKTKKTSGIELPEKNIISHKVILTPKQREIYEAYRTELIYEFKTAEGTVIDDAEVVLKRLLRLVQCAANPAIFDSSYDEMPAKFEALKSLLEKEIADDKVIIWTNFITNANWLFSNLKNLNPAIVHGEMAIDMRNNEIDKFKNDSKCRVLIATPGSAKEGLTLTVANHAIFYDRSFSLDDYLQAQDRIHRISQERDCYIHNLIAEDTIDEWTDQLLYAKFKAAQIVQGDLSPKNNEEIFKVDLAEMLAEALEPKANDRSK